MSDFREIECQWVWVNDFHEEDVRGFTEEVYARFYDNPYRPITICVDSYGGDVYSILGMLDVMDSIKAIAPEEFNFITCTLTKAMSAGALLLSQGDVRFASKSSSIMIHQTNSSPGWNMSFPKLEKDFEETKRLNDAVLKVLTRNIKLDITLEELRNKLSQNWHLDAFEARNIGLIDVVGVPKVNHSGAFEISVADGIKPEKKETKKREPSKKNRRTKKSSS